MGIVSMFTMATRYAQVSAVSNIQGTPYLDEKFVVGEITQGEQDPEGFRSGITSSRSDRIQTKWSALVLDPSPGHSESYFGDNTCRSEV